MDTVVLSEAVAVSGANETAVTIAARTDGSRVVIVGVAAYPGAANQNGVLIKATSTSGTVIGAIPSLTTSGNVPWQNCEVVGAINGAVAVMLETPQLNTNRLTVAYKYRKD